nr:MAG TPA: hypothetical protein [Caudoviricetes sp.]
MDAYDHSYNHLCRKYRIIKASSNKQPTNISVSFNFIMSPLCI